MIVKKILIDANPVVPYLATGKISGIGRTCMELISQFGQMRDSLPFKIELYTQNLKGVTAHSLNTGLKSHHIYLRNTPQINQWVRRLRLRELISRYDLQHITHNYELVADPSRCIVTVHDAFFMKIDVENFDYTQFRKTYPPFIRAARHIITCSEYSARDIRETMGVEAERITVIPWGIDHSIFHEEDKKVSRIKLADNYGITRPYFLSVSCDSGRKRTPELIRSYLSLAQPNNDLVLVWSNPTEEVLKSVRGNDRVHFISGVSNDTLRHLYNCATASINPTAYEGFGLPILEAMACGCVAVTCNNSSLLEVGGNVALYIDEPISKGLPKILNDLDKDLMNVKFAREEGPRRASLFSWERTAHETAEVYARELEKIK